MALASATAITQPHVPYPSSYRHSLRLCIGSTYTLPRLGEREVWDAEGLYGGGGYGGDGKSVEKSRNGLTEDLLESRWGRKLQNEYWIMIRGEWCQRRWEAKRDSATERGER